jgi:hypothetical protein
MSGLNIRGQAIIEGQAVGGFAPVAAPNSTAFTLKGGDPVLFVLDLTNGGDVTQYFSATPLVATTFTASNTNQVSGDTGFYVFQNTPVGNDFSSRKLLATFGVGPAG